MKWKCTNCENEFESEDEDYIRDEFFEHCKTCFDLIDFCKIIK